MLPRCLPPSFSSIRLIIEDFQDGCGDGHLGYHNKTILAILNLHVTLMPPTKFWLILISHSGADVVWKFSRWPPWRPSWLSKQNDFSNSESLCCTVASHQVLGSIRLRVHQHVVWRFLRWSPWQLSWISEQNDFSNSQSLCCSDASHQIFGSIRVHQHVAWRFLRWSPWQLSWI